MVGTATIGSRAVSAIALAAPTADPPPIATSTSAPARSAAALAASAVATGTCSRTSVNDPATRSASGAVSRATSSGARLEAMTSTRRPPSRSISPASAVPAAPAPNTTRAANWS